MTSNKKNSLALIEIPRQEELTGHDGTALFQLVQQECEDRLKTWTRPGDQLRQLSPTRFIAVLKGVESDDERRLAEYKLHRVFEEPITVLDEPIKVTIHTGMVLLEETKDLKQAIRQAGLALQRSRKETPNESDTAAELSGTTFHTREDLVSALHKALELGEFHLNYQPKIHAGFRSLIGAEALLRWYRNGKLVVTEQFLSAAEHSSVTKPLTWWLLKSVVAQLSQWQDSLSIEIQLPKTLIGDTDLRTVLTDAFELFEVTSNRLIVDVGEDFILQETSMVLPYLESLKSTGVRISVSNIGNAQLKAYPALRNLRKTFKGGRFSDSADTPFPIDELKLSPSLTRDDQTSRQNATVIKTFVDLAHEFSIRIGCSGIESQQMAAATTKLGCDILQGEFIGKELARQEFEKNYQVSKKQKPTSKPVVH